VRPFLETSLYIEIIIGPYYYAYKNSYNRNIGLQSVTEMVEQHVIIAAHDFVTFDIFLPQYCSLNFRNFNRR